MFATAVDLDYRNGCPFLLPRVLEQRFQGGRLASKHEMNKMRVGVSPWPAERGKKRRRENERARWSMGMQISKEPTNMYVCVDVICCLHTFSSAGNWSQIRFLIPAWPQLGLSLPSAWPRLSLPLGPGLGVRLARLVRREKPPDKTTLAMRGTHKNRLTLSLLVRGSGRNS